MNHEPGGTGVNALTSEERTLLDAIHERWGDGVITTATATRLAKDLGWDIERVRTVAQALAARQLLAFNHDAAWPVATGTGSHAGGESTRWDGFQFTLSYFAGKVRELAAGRRFSATLTTTDTVQSDGAAMRVLMWHGWIDGHRSVFHADMAKALEWLRDGSGEDGRIGGMAGTAQDLCQVTAGGWTAGTAERPHWEWGHADGGHTAMAHVPQAEGTACTPSRDHRLEPCPRTAQRTHLTPGTPAWYYDDARRRVSGVVTRDEGITGALHLKVAGHVDAVRFDAHERYRVLCARTHATDGPKVPPYTALRLLRHPDGTFWSAITQETGELEAHNIGECAFETTPDAIEELAIQLLTMLRARRCAKGGSP